MPELGTLVYRRQPDGTYVWEGELVAAAASYQMVCANSGNPFGDFTLEKAKSILEAGPLKQDWYKIIPVPDRELSGAVAKKVARKAEKIASGEIAPKREYKLCPVCNRPLKGKAEGLDAHRKCTGEGYQAYKPKELSAEEQARVQEIIKDTGQDAATAKKLLRAEQRRARLKAAKAAGKTGNTGKSKLDSEKIANMHRAGAGVGEIARALGCSYMGVRLNLVRQGLLQTKAE